MVQLQASHLLVLRRHALHLLLQRRLPRCQLLLQRLRRLQLLPQGSHLGLGSSNCLSNRGLMLLARLGQLLTHRGKLGLGGGSGLGRSGLLLLLSLRRSMGCGQEGENIKKMGRPKAKTYPTFKALQPGAGAHWAFHSIHVKSNSPTAGAAGPAHLDLLARHRKFLLQLLAPLLRRCQLLRGARCSGSLRSLHQSAGQILYVDMQRA